MMPKLLHFNFRKLGSEYLLANDIGDYAYLSAKEFSLLTKKKKLASVLRGKFWIENDEEINSISSRLRYSKSYLNQSTSLFIVVLTARCNLSCVYCQASRKNCDNRSFDMDFATAQKAINLILESPSNDITIEFQGGEPLINYEVLKYIVTELRIKVSRSDRSIRFNLVSNLVLLNDEKLNFLIENKVSICTSLDGDKETHDFNRPGFGGFSSYDSLIQKIKVLKDTYKEKSLKDTVNAIQTTTNKSLYKPKEIIDEYVKQGFNSIYLRPLSPFGLATNNENEMGYSPYEYLKFYKDSLDHILDINEKGYLLIERTTQIFLQRILKHNGSSFVDLRSPCGAVLGQIAINYDGDLYTCDEGRMMAETGDKTFKIGSVDNDTYQDICKSLVTKSMCLASCSECAQRCHQCVYRPFCGVCPVMNYSTEKDIFKNSSYRCVINEGILDHIFSLLTDTETNKIFSSWVY